MDDSLVKISHLTSETVNGRRSRNKEQRKLTGRNLIFS